MPLQKIVLKPGVNRENTRYTNEGGWYESDKVRFRQGTPEKIGGWARISASYFQGVCRSLWNWVTLASQNLLGVGTNLKFYISQQGEDTYYDITPITAVRTLTNPFTTVNGSSTVTVADASGGYTVNSFVTFNGATAVSGLTINGEYQITSADTVSYTIDVGDLVIAPGATGGGTVYAAYQVNASPAAVIPFFGWGSGTWGSGIWGTSDTADNSLRIWNQNNFGQNLLYGPRGGPLYYWDATIGFTPTTATFTNGTPGIVSSALTLADNTPVQFETTAALPTGLIPSTTYYTRYKTSTTFWLATTPTEVFMTATCSGAGTNTLTVSAIASGTLVVGMTVYYLSGSSYLSLGTLTFTGTGTGGAGTYTVSAGASVSSRDMAASALVTLSGTASGTNSISPRGVPISALPGASETPLRQNFFTVSDASRFVICFGTNDYLSTVFDPMLIRWSDQESVTQWTPAITNQAGSIRLSHGSKIVTALQSRQEIVVWTDSTFYSLQYLGPPYVWGTTLLADNVSIASPNAAALASGVTYWMGVDKFYKYDGRVQTLNCDLQKFIYDNINRTQFDQIYASTNEGFNEVWFFYCTEYAVEIDRYVVYNYLENCWYYGSMSRSAWLDTGLRNYPLAATYDPVALTGNIVYHEYGVDDNTTGTAVAMESFITSAQFDIGDGYNFAFVWRMLPDLTFLGSTDGTVPSMTLQLLPLQNSGSGYNDPKSIGGVYNQQYPSQAQRDAFFQAAIAVLKMIVGIIPIDLYYDLNGDGIISLADSTGFQNLSLGTPLTYTPNPASIYTAIAGQGNTATEAITATQTYPITAEGLDRFNGQLNIRVRGRQMSMKLSSNTLGTQWQMGAPRIDIRPDGRR